MTCWIVAACLRMWLSLSVRSLTSHISCMAKELEKQIVTNKYDFQPDYSLETDVILDSIQVTLSAAKNICQPKLVHVVFDSYCELSVKEGERVRRAAKLGAHFEVVDISGSVPIPQQADNMALRDFDNVVVSGMIENEKVQSAKAQVNRRSGKEVPELSKWQEEAYSINISHIAGRLTIVLRGLL